MAPSRARPRGRWRRALAPAAAVCLAGSIGFVAAATPAAAAARLEVDAGWAGGHYVAGRPVPVRVDVAADQLLTGSLQVSLAGPAGPSVTVPVEVPGGTTKRFLVGLPTPTDGRAGSVDARLVGDDDARGEADVTRVDDVELVGLLPGIVGQAPGVTPLAVDAGTVRFELLDEPEATTVGVLGGLGTIVAPADGLRALSAPARANVLDWVADGGFLVVDAPSGTAVHGLPEAWQPGDAGRVGAGRGEVRLSDGAAAAGRWSDVVEPTPLTNFIDLGFGGFFANESLADSVARDGGLRVPDVGWLAAFLVVYLVLAGPLVFLVLRRMGRAGWTWVALPALAVVFSGVAFVVGDELRTGSRAAHASMIETGPSGPRLTTHVGLVSRNGADGEARFPDGWQASSYQVNPMFGGPGVGGNASRTEVTTEGGHPVAHLPLDAGGFGVVSGWGPGDGLDGAATVDGLEVTATAAADGSLSGTVRNGTRLALDETVVFVGRRAVAVGRLEAGATEDWSLAVGEGGPDDPRGPVETPWLDAIGWDDGRPDPDSVVNYSLWSDELSRRVDAYGTGEVVVAGWNREWVPPIDAGGTIDGGRTVLTARAPVAAAPGTVPADAVRRDVVRGPGSTRVALDDDAMAEFGPPGAGVVRFALPPGADPGVPLVLEGPAMLRRAEAWVGGRWVRLALEALPAREAAEFAGGDAAGGGAQPQPAEPPPVVGDPFDAGMRVVGGLPAGAVHDGVVYVRVGVITDGVVWNDLTLRGVA
ncbi:MAG TPA: hypothetical protein VE623_22995 [Acidimicrobiales bacterium]|nr:hypothetical protein [Acidimicrobiales bacterium]